jgi:hypothetical protein
MRGRQEGWRFQLEATLALLLLAGAPAAPADSLDPPISVGKGLDATVSAAVRSASRKLESPACRMIFSDFEDGHGHTLQENLDALGQTGGGYLGWMIFHSGHDRPVRGACQNPSILAATEPGSRVIRICPRQFRERQLQSPGFAAAMIIHEELHSLGLGENPPDSKEITQQVIARCGR